MALKLEKEYFYKVRSFKSIIRKNKYRKLYASVDLGLFSKINL